MKKKLVIPLLFLALIVSASYGYSQYQMRKQWEINAENQYQRAFQELTGHVDNMETAMSQATVAGSFPQSVRLMTSIWREANSSQENLGQLPLTSMELSNTKMLLAKVGTFSFNAAQNRLLKGTAVNETEWKTLKSLHEQTQLVSKHLRELQQQFFTTRATWLQVDRLGTVGATGLANRFNNNNVTKAFIMLEDGLRRSPDVSFEGNNLNFVPKPTGLSGKNVSIAEALAIAKKIVGPDLNGASVKYDRTVKSGFTSYLITASNRRRPGRDRTLSISAKGGHLAWMLTSRNVQRTRLSLAQAEAKAVAFLNRIGYLGMHRVSREQYANIATITLAPLCNQVLYYPELIKVQVARDNGEILGADAIPYLTFYNPNEPKTAVKPSLTESQIRKLLNKHFKPEKFQLAEVLDEMYNKVLCYEVTGTQGADRYLLYYNAATGKEEKIRRIDRNGNEIQ